MYPKNRISLLSGFSNLKTIIPLILTLLSLGVVVTSATNIFHPYSAQNITRTTSIITTSDIASTTRSTRVGNIVFERLKKCLNKQKIRVKKRLTQAQCETECANNAGIVALY